MPKYNKNESPEMTAVLGPQVGAPKSKSQAPKKAPPVWASDIPAVGKSHGLGCPDCKWTGSSLRDRSDHITEAHPGAPIAHPEIQFMLQQMDRTPTSNFHDRRGERPSNSQGS